MFDNCNNTLQKGALGLSKAIFEYSRQGYSVCLPLVDAQDYDLVIEKDGQFQSVQCKATSVKSKFGYFLVDLRSSKTNCSTTVNKPKGEYDLLFVLNSDGQCYSIPAELLPPSGISLGSKWEDYKLTYDNSLVPKIVA